MTLKKIDKSIYITAILFVTLISVIFSSYANLFILMFSMIILIIILGMDNYYNKKFKKIKCPT